MLREYVRRRRLELGYEQAELADATGCLDIDGNYITRLENGHIRTIPKAHVLRGLAVGLGVSILDLLREAGYLEDGEGGVNEAGMLRVRQYEMKRELSGIRDHLDRIVRQIDSEYPNVTNGAR